MRYAPLLLLPFVFVTAAAAQGLPPAEGPWAGYVPDTTLSTFGEASPDTDLVVRLFALANTEACGPALDGGYGGPEPQVFDFTYVDSLGGEERPYRLYQFNCFGGAYNLSSVFYGWDLSWGLRQLSFAAPEVTVTYATHPANGEEDDTEVTGLALAGMHSRLLLTNAEVDPATGTIEAVSHWRGLGDASSRGVWVLRDGEYALSTYEVDGSYDGEVDRVPVVDYGSPVAVGK